MNRWEDDAPPYLTPLLTPDEADLADRITARMAALRADKRRQQRTDALAIGLWHLADWRRERLLSSERAIALALLAGMVAGYLLRLVGLGG